MQQQFQPIKLSKNQYKKLAMRIVIRDGYKCRRCGSRDSLSVHHHVKRSKVRLDVDWNLICVCVICHQKIEDGLLFIEQDPALKVNGNVNTNYPVIFITLAALLKEQGKKKQWQKKTQ